MTKVEINGRIVEFENPPSEQDIDEAAVQLGQSPKYPSQDPIHAAAGFAGDIMKEAVRPSFTPVSQRLMAPVAKPYSQSREQLIDKTGIDNLNLSKEGLKIPIMSPEQPLEEPGNIDLSPNSLARGGVGALIDLATGLVTPGAAKASFKVSKIPIKGADKTITSLLRRVAGQEGTNIKQLRDLESKYGPGFVLSKTKSKPAYLGREVAPKASALASKRVSTMEPEALREINISPENVEAAQRLKGRFDIKKFPTRNESDQVFAQVINSAPGNVNIPTTNLENALIENGHVLGSKESKFINSLLNRSSLNETGTLSKKGISVQEYKIARQILNDASQGGKNASAQALKNALDRDAETIISGLSEAKGGIQLSEDLSKAESYLDKTRLSQEMETKLSQASEPQKVGVRDSLKRLLGPEGDYILDEANAQRIAKELYQPSGTGSGRIGLKDARNLITTPGRAVLRMYEMARSRVKGKK